MKSMLARFFMRVAVRLGAPDGYECDKLHKDALGRIAWHLNNANLLKIHLDQAQNNHLLTHEKLNQMSECCYCMVRNLYRYGVSRDHALNVSLDPMTETTNVELQRMWERARREVKVGGIFNNLLDEVFQIPKS